MGILEELISSPAKEWQKHSASRIGAAMAQNNLQSSRTAVQECLRLLSDNGRHALTTKDIETTLEFAKNNLHADLQAEFWHNLRGIQRSGLAFDRAATEFVETKFRQQTPITAPERHALGVTQKAMRLSHIEGLQSQAPKPKPPLWKRILGAFRK